MFSKILWLNGISNLLLNLINCEIECLPSNRLNRRFGAIVFFRYLASAIIWSSDKESNMSRVDRVRGALCFLHNPRFSKILLFLSIFFFLPSFQCKLRDSIDLPLEILLHFSNRFCLCTLPCPLEFVPSLFLCFPYPYFILVKFIFCSYILSDNVCTLTDPPAFLQSFPKVAKLPSHPRLVRGALMTSGPSFSLKNFT